MIEIPKALVVADMCEAEIKRTVNADLLHHNAALELRRLHAENEKLRAALAEVPMHGKCVENAEPVAWALTETLNERKTTTRGCLWFSNPMNDAWTPLYTHPPRREWVGLTDEDINEAIDATFEGGSLFDTARAVETLLKEKNA